MRHVDAYVEIHGRMQELECRLKAAEEERDEAMRQAEAARQERDIIARAYEAERQRANRLQAQLDDALMVVVS